MRQCPLPWAPVAPAQDTSLQTHARHQIYIVSAICCLKKETFCAQSHSHLIVGSQECKMVVSGLELGSQLCTCALRWKWKWQKGNSVARERERAWRPRSTQSSQGNPVKISTPQVWAGFARKEEFKGKEINFIWSTNQVEQNLWCKVIESDRVKLITIRIKPGSASGYGCSECIHGGIL
jgi:hypothetical protein